MLRRIAVVLIASAIVMVVVMMSGAGPATAQKAKGKAKAAAPAKQAPMPQTGGIPLGAVAAPAALGAGVLLIAGGMLIRRKIR